MKVIITTETKGYDISAYDESGTKVNTTWKPDRQAALFAANNMADYYRDLNGQRAQVIY